MGTKHSILERDEVEITDISIPDLIQRFDLKLYNLETLRRESRDRMRIIIAVSTISGWLTYLILWILYYNGKINKDGYIASNITVIFTIATYLATKRLSLSLVESGLLIHAHTFSQYAKITCNALIGLDSAFASMERLRLITELEEFTALLTYGNLEFRTKKRKIL